MGDALRRDGTRGLIELYKQMDGADYPREYPPWAEAATLQADPQALLAADGPELVRDGVNGLETYPVPVLLIAGELEDPADRAAAIAATVPNGERLVIPGRGHGGAASLSAPALPIVRAFLERWLG